MKHIVVLGFWMMIAIKALTPVPANAGMPTEYYRQTFVGVENIIFSVKKKETEALQLLPLEQKEMNDMVQEILNRRLTEKYDFKVFTPREGDYLRAENETLKTVLFVDVMLSVESFSNFETSESLKVGAVSLLLTRYIREIGDSETLRPIKSSWFPEPFIIYDDKEQFKQHFAARMEDTLFGYLKGVICRNYISAKECVTLPSHIRDLEILKDISPEIKKNYEFQKKKWEEHLETLEE